MMINYDFEYLDVSQFIRFFNYENYEDNLKIEVFFDDVITGQDDVITFRFSLAFKISG